MTENAMYRVAEGGKPTGYGPYDTIGVARNVASQMYGGFWKGQNKVLREKKVYSYETQQYVTTRNTYTIQKLAPVFKQIHPSGAFQLSLEWVDVDA